MTAKTLVSPSGSTIVATCAMQAVYVGIAGVDDDSLDPDFGNVTPAGHPTPVRTDDGSLLLVDDGGEFWTMYEVQSGVRQDGPHHVVAEINRRLKLLAN